MNLMKKSNGVSREKIWYTVLAVFLLTTSTATSAIAQTRTVGVSQGDQFKYGNINVEWNSDNPNATIHSSLKDMNHTEYISIFVKDVSGTNVTCEMTQHFQDGTEDTEQGYIDVDTGNASNLTFLPFPFISAGLQKNDSIYTSEYYAEGYINETVTRTYPDGTRETNHLNITSEYSGEQQYRYLADNFYWDKPTGTLVEVTETSIHESGGYTNSYSISVKITQSNKWTIPEFPPRLIIPLLLTATLITTILTKRKLQTPDRKK